VNFVRDESYFAKSMGELRTSSNLENGRGKAKRGWQFDELLLAPPLEGRRLQCYLALLISDIGAIIGGLILAGLAAHGSKGLVDAAQLGIVLCFVFALLAFNNQAYSIAALGDMWFGMVRAQKAVVLSVAAVVFLDFFVKAEANFSRVELIGGAVCGMLLLGIMRYLARPLIRASCGSHVINQLVIDDGGAEVKIRGAIHASARDLCLKPDLRDPHALDRFGLVLRNIDRVVISCPPERRSAWAMMLKGTNVDGEVLDDAVAQLGAQGARVAGNKGLLLVSVGPLGLRDRMIKRVFDLTCVGLAIVALSPLLLIIAMAIKVQDGGSILFVQRRMGRGNRFFNMYKFRSMSEALCDKDGVQSASKEDQRITKVGRFIRSTSLDELPQLFNVLLGDMSLVGPRPHATGSMAGDKLFWEVDLRYWQRHCLKPGLSGLAQVRGFRGATEKEADLVNRLQSDLEYLEGWSITRDVKIIALTLRVLVHDRAF